MLVTSQGWGLGGTSPFSRAWALCVTPVLLGDPLGPSHCLVARGANRAGSVSRNTRAPGAAPLCKMRGGGAGFPAVWGRLLPLCLSYGTLLSPAALPGSRKGWFPCGSFFSLVGKTQIFQARLSAAVALSRGRRDTATDVPGPSYRRGRQRWPGQGQTEGQRAWATSHWRHVHVCTRAHTRLSLLWASLAPLVSAPSPLCLSLSTPLPLLPPHPSLLPLLPLFSLGLMKAPGKGRDCVKCPQ